MERLKIEYIPIKELTAYVGNAKEVIAKQHHFFTEESNEEE